MLTWKLWRALCRPPIWHPLFERVVSAPSGAGLIQRTLRFTAFYLTACLLLTFAWPLILSNPLLVLLFAAASANTLYSAIWAARIGSAIAREHEQQTWDIICLLPVGALGAGWMLSTALLHRSPVFRALHLFMQSLSLAVIGALLTIIPVTLTLASGSPASYGLFMLMDYGGVLAAAFYFDHIQSLTLAHLLGMIAASKAQNRINSQLWSAGIFLLLQLLTYLLALVLGFIMLPVLLAQLPMTDLARIALLPIICLALFYAARESVIRLTWQILVRHFNATTADERQIFRTSVL